MQQIVFLTALLHWLVTEELMDVEQLETKFKRASDCVFFLDPLSAL